MGKGKGSHVEAQEHRSRPLASLKDPSAFGPPPKHVKYHGDAAASHETTSDADESVTPLSNDGIARPREPPAEDAAPLRQGPPVPYRADTTGLSTRNLPKPPVRYAEAPNFAGISSTKPLPRPKPPLPPRLPPRQMPPPSQEDAPEAPPPYSALPSHADKAGSPVNQGALSRLGSAGIRVPGLGIGGAAASLNPGQGRTQGNRESSSSIPVAEQGSQSPGLPSQLSNLSIQSSSPTQAPARGTSFAQKQAALKTASAFRNDPTSISFSDAKATAATANNFRKRHGEQVVAGWQAGSALNQKYDIANKLNDRAPADNEPGPHQGSRDSAMKDGPGMSALGIRGRPAPPVPKKSFAEGDPAPTVPPVPWSSKPKP